jgi:hypothetical protein
MPHVDYAAASLAHDGECLDEQVVQRFPVRESLAQLRSLGAQLLVREGLDRRLEEIMGFGSTSPAGALGGSSRSS